MASRLLEFLRLGRCSHEFSWPRRWPDGEYYQVCLLCGDEYRYDWNTMSRLERVSGMREAQESARTGSDQAPPNARKKPRWSPRARRIKLSKKEIKYRQAGTAAWNHGAVQNVSQSGVLFRAAEVVPENTELEMILELPGEITGQEHAQVMARGMVVRTVPPKSGQDKPAIAAGIWDYRVLHDNNEDKSQHSSTADPKPPKSDKQPDSQRRADPL